MDIAKLAKLNTKNRDESIAKINNYSNSPTVHGVKQFADSTLLGLEDAVKTGYDIATMPFDAPSYNEMTSGRYEELRKEQHTQTPSGEPTLAQELGSLLGAGLGASPLLRATRGLNYGGRLLADNAIFTATGSPEMLGSKAGENKFTNIDPKQTYDSFVDNTLLSVGLETPLLAVKHANKLKNIAKKTTELGINKTKKIIEESPFGEKIQTENNENINDIRIHKDNIDNFIEAEPYNETRDYYDFDIIDTAKLAEKNLKEKLSGGEPVNISDIFNDSVEVVDGKTKSLSKDNIILKEDKSIGENNAFVVPEDAISGIDGVDAGALKDSKIIIVGENFKNKTPEQQRIIIEHELTHSENMNKTGNEYRVLDEVATREDDILNMLNHKKLSDHTKAIISDIDKFRYYMNESEAVATMNTVIDKIASGEKLDGKDYVALDLYSALTDSKKKWNEMSDAELISEMNKAQDVISEIYKEDKKLNDIDFREKNENKINNFKQRLFEKIGAVNSRLGAYADDIKNAKNKMLEFYKKENDVDKINNIEFAYKTQKQHIADIEKLRNMYNKTKDKNKKVEIFEEYIKYRNRLLKKFDFDFNEKIERNTHTVSGKPIDMKNFDIESGRVMLETDKLLKELLSSDSKIYERIKEDAINKEIEHYNKQLDIVENRGEALDSVRKKWYKKTDKTEIIEKQKKENLKTKEKSIDKEKAEVLISEIKEEARKTDKKKNETKTTKNKTEHRNTQKTTEKKKKNNIDNTKKTIKTKVQKSIIYMKTKFKDILNTLPKPKNKNTLIEPKVEIGRINPITGKIDFGFVNKKNNKIFMSEFTENGGLGFENELLILAHELVHIYEKNNSILKEKIKNIVIPDSINTAYKDFNEYIKQEEALATYSSFRLMLDIAKDKKINEHMTKEFISNAENIIELFEKNNSELKDIYENTIYPAYYDSIKTTGKLLNRLMEPQLLDIMLEKLEDADTVIASKIEDLLGSIFKKANIRKITQAIDSSAIASQIKNDILIGHSQKEVYKKIRNIFATKHKYLTSIKNINNTIIKNLKTSPARKALGKEKYNEIMMKLKKINSIADLGGNTKIKDKLKELVKNQNSNMRKLLKDTKIEFAKKVFRDSTEPTNSKYYFKNEYEIYNFFVAKKLLKDISKEEAIKAISDILDAEVVKKENMLKIKELDIFDTSTIDRDIISLIKEIEKEELGSDYIRGYDSFVAKNNVVSAISFNGKVPTGFKRYKNTPFIYKLDTRANIENNILEFQQDSILGTTYMIKNKTKKEIERLKSKIKYLNKSGIEPARIFDSKGDIIGIKVFFSKDFDIDIMNRSNDVIENMASQFSSLKINALNKKLADKIQEDIGNIFVSEDKITERNSHKYVKLSKAEIKAFRQSGSNITHVDKAFKNILTAQHEFMFSKENQVVARVIEKGYKNLIRSLKKNVTIYNVKSIVNNLAVVPSVLVAHGVKPTQIGKNISKTISDYKVFFKAIDDIKTDIITLRNIKDTKIKEKTISKIKERIQALKQNNVFAQLHEQGAIQTLADAYLMKNEKKNGNIETIFNIMIADNKAKNNEHIEKIENFLNDISVKSIQAMNFADLVGRGSLYRSLIEKGYEPREASRITNEAFVDFRRTYPKIINELDNYGLPFIGFMYRNSINIMKLYKDKPVTMSSILASMIIAHEIAGNSQNDIGGIRTASWEYQRGLIDDKFLAGSTIFKLLQGNPQPQMIVSNNALILERVASGKETPLALMGLTVY